MDRTPKEKVFDSLSYTLHVKGIFINGFEIYFNTSDYEKFYAWYNDLTDDMQWKVLDAYRPMTRYERRHVKIKHKA